MTQTRLHLRLKEGQARQLAGQLEALFEEEGFPVASFEEDEAAGIWSVSLYVPAEDAAGAATAMRRTMASLGLSGEPGEEQLDEEGWVERTLDALAPVRAGRFVVHGSHDRGCAAANEIAVEIDAGMAFGTGHHGTTAGCLDALTTVLKKRCFTNALDLGAGTGVLAIALAKAARIPVLASDIDPVADRIARENARLNGASAWVETLTAAGFSHRRFNERGPFDLVVANILARPLQALASDMAAHCKPGATVILSGLLPHQQARIVASYRLQGFSFEQALIRDGWLVLTLRSMRRRRA